jgi:hypothetical protein
MVATILAEHRRRPFDVLHAQYGYPNGWAVLLAAREIGVPTVVSIQGGDGHWVGSCCETHRLAMLRVLDGADALLIGCDSFAGEVVERSASRATASRSSRRRRHRPLPPAGSRPGRRPAAAAVPRPRRPPERRAGFPGCAGAAARAGRALRRHCLRHRAGLRQLARPGRRAGVPVRFTGYADYDAAPALYREADVFVSPTYAEGFSNTILEAMANGLPSVSCYAVGVVDCLRDGENGLLVQPGDIPALAQALRRVIEDAPLRRRLASARWRNAGAPIPGRRWGGRSWTSTPRSPAGRPIPASTRPAA